MIDSSSTEIPDYQYQKGKVYCIGELSRAIIQGELLLNYQPRYQSSTGELVTLEALVRWQHPDLGLLYPAAFLPLAEQTGLISNLGLWVIEQCCKDIAWLKRQLNTEVPITINVSPSQCEYPGMAQKILDICNDYDIAPSDFIFEVTRCEISFKKDKVMHFCTILNEAGASYNIIDKGKGRASLENLCDLNVNMIKLSKDFLDNISSNMRKVIVGKRVIELAHELNLKVVAIGIEHADQLDLVTRMNCDLIQGFLMSRPEKAEHINSNVLRM